MLLMMMICKAAAFRTIQTRSRWCTHYEHDFQLPNFLELKNGTALWTSVGHCGDIGVDIPAEDNAIVIARANRPAFIRCECTAPVQ